MTGTFITIEHRCVLPEIEKHMGVRTVWQCECGLRFYVYHHGIDLVWMRVHESDWVESENRLKTREEQLEESMARAVANDQPAVIKKKSRWSW
jgi:hypothetical protein